MGRILKLQLSKPYLLFFLWDSDNSVQEVAWNIPKLARTLAEMHLLVFEGLLGNLETVKDSISKTFVDQLTIPDDTNSAADLIN